MMDLNSPNEPTQVLSMLSAFNTQMRHSTSGSRLSMTNTQGELILHLNISRHFLLLLRAHGLLSGLLTRVIVFQASR